MRYVTQGGNGMVESYEVKLVLMNDIDSPYNPVFEFENEEEAIELMKVFIEQGYSALISVEYAD